MEPQRYQQPQADALGYLAASRAAARPPRASHPALQALVVQRWASAASDRAAASCSDKQRRAWLLRRGFAGFAAAAAEGRALLRRAAVQHQKRVFLAAGRCFAAWWARIRRRRELAELQRQGGELRRAALLRSAARAWRGWLAARKAAQKAWARAEAYHAFCSLGRNLDAWRDWARRRAARRAATQQAAAHAVRALRRRALRGWKRWADQRALARQQDELATGYDRLRRLAGALLGWRAATTELAARRERAEERIRTALYGLDLRLLGLAMRGWRAAAARRAALRESSYIAQRLHRFNTLARCWQGWVATPLLCLGGILEQGPAARTRTHSEQTLTPTACPVNTFDQIYLFSPTFYNDVHAGGWGGWPTGGTCASWPGGWRRCAPGWRCALPFGPGERRSVLRRPRRGRSTTVRCSCRESLPRGGRPLPERLSWGGWASCAARRTPAC